MTRLDSYLLKWMTLGNIEQNFDALHDFFVREQFITACHEDLAVFLREKKPKDGKEAIENAERYIEAHGGEISYRAGLRNKKNIDRLTTATSLKPTDQNKRDRKGFTPVEERVCFKCGMKGHMSKNCSSSAVPRGEERVCWLCSKSGHIAKSCPTIKKGVQSTAGVIASPGDAPTCSCHLQSTNAQEKMEFGCSIIEHQCRCRDFVSLCAAIEPQAGRESKCQCSGMNVYTQKGYLNGKPVTVMRDNGCSSAVVSKTHVEPSQYTGEYRYCWLGDTSVRKLPVARVQVNSPYFKGEVEAMVMTTPLFECIIGNIPGAYDAKEYNKDWKPPSTPNSQITAAVTTRSQSFKEKQPQKPLRVPAPVDAEGDQEELLTEQLSDSTLQILWQKARQKEAPKMTKVAQTWFEVEDKLLYRCHQKLQGIYRPIVKQLLVPQSRRTQVLKLAHEAVMAGHQGIGRTLERIQSTFYWPGIHRDVTLFCKSCDVCQRTIQKGKVSKVPLEEMPIIDIPFRRIAIDIVGPISPVSERKNRYILTIVDFATRYPEAIALPSIHTEVVAEALLEVYSRVGFPSEVLSDIGSNI